MVDEDQGEPDPATVLSVAEQMQAEPCSDFSDCDPMVGAALLAMDGFNATVYDKMDALASAWETLRASVDLEGILSETGDWQLSGTSLVKIRDRDSNDCFYGDGGGSN
jgi:hypothetical protein